MLRKGLLIVLGILTLFGWSALGFTIALFSPESFVARLFFFSSLFIAVCFTFSLPAYYLSLRISPLERPVGELRQSIIRGIPPAVAVVIAFWLQSLRAFGIASGVILLLAVLLVEVATIVKGRRNRETRRIQEASR